MSGSRTDLARDVERAAAELAAIRTSDPAARAAIRAVRLTTHTLRSFWLPALSADRNDGD